MENLQIALEFVTQNGQFIKTQPPDDACFRDFL